MSLAGADVYCGCSRLLRVLTPIEGAYVYCGCSRLLRVLTSTAGAHVYCWCSRLLRVLTSIAGAHVYCSSNVYCGAHVYYTGWGRRGVVGTTSAGRKAVECCDASKGNPPRSHRDQQRTWWGEGLGASAGRPPPRWRQQAGRLSRKCLAGMMTTVSEALHDQPI